MRSSLPALSGDDAELGDRIRRQTNIFVKIPECLTHIEPAKMSRWLDRLTDVPEAPRVMARSTRFKAVSFLLPINDEISDRKATVFFERRDGVLPDATNTLTSRWSNEPDL